MPLRSLQQVFHIWLLEVAKEDSVSPKKNPKKSILDKPGLVKRTTKALGIANAQIVPAARLPGTELVALGGGESVQLPGVRTLPISASDKEHGLAGTSLVLPPSAVRILKGVHIQVRTGVVTLENGCIVAESMPISKDRRMKSPRRSSASTHLAGNVAPYGSTLDDVCAGITEAFPKIVLLQHPAVRRYGPITVVHAGLSPIERFLLSLLDSQQILTEHVGPAAVIQGDRTMLPGPVTRRGTSGSPSWFQEWLDRSLAEISPPRASLMIALIHGAADPLADSDVLNELKAGGFVVIDTSALTLDGSVPSDGISPVVGAIRDASVVVGATDSALAHALLCERADVVHLGLADVVTARPIQLCASKGLNYHFTKPELLGPTLSSLKAN